MNLPTILIFHPSNGLEKYLQHYQGSVVIVSHDKYFLNRMVTKIVELYQQQLHIYRAIMIFTKKRKRSG